jgi:hypothetical protein
MPLVSFALLALGAAPVFDNVTLYRGAELPGQALRYWAVEDTVLDSTQPEGNLGGQSYLPLGTGKVMLIRFGDLRRALGPNKKIAKASILFTITGGDPAPLAQASEMLVPWGEGPTQVIAYAALPPNVSAPAWSATWRNRRAGEGAISWQQQGASGPGDSRPLAEVRANSPDNDHIRIEGLAEAMQRQYERPYEAFGFRIAFEGTVEFASSQNRQGRPLLELQVEDTAPAKGPDLAVVKIVRAPEHPRFGPPSTVHPGSQDGLEIPIPGPPANLSEKHWPGNGEEVVYTATIQNVGDAPASGFSARWSRRERPGSAVEVARPLAPGEQTTLTYRSEFRNEHEDHRLLPLSLLIAPAGPDANWHNDALEIQENALAVGIRFAPGADAAIAQKMPLGATTSAEYAQAIVRLWNETIFPQSRFSFAPDGALERLRLQRLEVGQGKLADLNLDIEMTLTGTEPLGDVLKEMGLQMGLADLSLANLRPGKPILMNGLSVERFAPDIAPGIMGGGDTRNEAAIPRALVPPHEPLFNPVFDALPLEATGLLSATDVGALNAALGLRRGFSSESLYGLPATLLLKVVDTAGIPVKNATVEVVPILVTTDGAKAGPAIATPSTGESGTIALSPRETALPEGFKTISGKALGPNVFGRLDPAGKNAVLMLRVTAGGSSDVAFLKSWQVADVLRRDPTPAPVMELRVHVGGDVERGTNLAANRIVADSSNMLPAKLAPLIDGSPATEVELAGGKGAWVELDLGRDRAFGEVRLSSKGAFWEQFSVQIYATGQTIGEAKTMAREASWSWARANRSDGEDGGARSVAYRTQGIRARFIRITRLSDGPSGTLSEIKVLPLRGP